MIAISLVFDRLWSQSRVNDLIVIRSWLRQALCVGLTCYARSIFHHQVWYCTLPLHYVRAMHIFDSRASSSPPGYIGAEFRFCHALHCWASLWRKIAHLINQSLTHSPSLFDVLGTEAFASEKNSEFQCFISHLTTSEIILKLFQLLKLFHAAHE